VDRPWQTLCHRTEARLNDCKELRWIDLSPVDDMGRSAQIRLTSDEEPAPAAYAITRDDGADGLKALVMQAKSDLRFSRPRTLLFRRFPVHADFIRRHHPQCSPSSSPRRCRLGAGRAAPTGLNSSTSAPPGHAVGEILARKAIFFRQGRVVGLIDAVSAIHMTELSQAAPTVEFVDATDGFEHIRRVKSPEELANLQHISRYSVKSPGNGG